MNLIKEKRCGHIKGGTFANGSKQRKYLKPYEIVYLPTCSTKELMATFVIYAIELRDMAILDVPGAFILTALPADMFVLMQIRVEFVNVICEVKPEYIPYVRYENGEKVLYRNILGAIYGCIDSAVLWYKL